MVIHADLLKSSVLIDSTKAEPDYVRWLYMHSLKSSVLIDSTKAEPDYVRWLYMPIH